MAMRAILHATSSARVARSMIKTDRVVGESQSSGPKRRRPKAVAIQSSNPKHDAKPKAVAMQVAPMHPQQQRFIAVVIRGGDWKRWQ